jgi:hypothetical protein
MRMLGSWARSHPFRTWTLFLALVVLGVSLGDLVGGMGGFLAQLVFQVFAVMLGMAFMWAGRG